MRPLLVVNAQPSLGDGPEFGDRFEEMGVQHFGAIAAIEALDVRVLIGLARLDVVRGDAVLGTPLDEGLGREFWAVVPSECEVKAGQVLL